MSGNPLTSLRDFLISNYDELKKRLTYRLGNVDMASDALQDTYLRLQDKSVEQKDAAPSVAHPVAYLLQMAFHIAMDRERSAERRLTVEEAEGFLDIVDSAPGPLAIAEGREDLMRLLQDLETLPKRQREILLAVRLDGESREQLALRYRISLRTVDRELERGYAFCHARIRESDQ